MRIPWQNNGPRILLSLSSLSLFIDHPPRRITADTLGGRKRGRADETVCSRVKTPSGRPNSPLSSPRTFTRTFHVCWLRVEAWIISAHAQLRASRRRVKTIPTAALRSVRRGTWSRTVLFVLLDIILPVSACSPVQVVFLRIRFVCFLFRAFLIREIGDCLSGDCVEFKKWVLKST